MKSALLKSAVASALFILLGTLLCAAQELTTANAPTKANSIKNPEGVSFTIQFKDGRTQFRQGETIRLELQFSSSLPATYKLDSATYDRSGRLEIDNYHVEPQSGVSDPLEDHYRSNLFGFMGGGLRGYPDLEQKPYIITAELNEWVRFDQPGKYKMYVRTGRISKTSGDRFPKSGQTIVVTSNAIDFEILPQDATSSKQALQQATALLAGKSEEDRRAGCRALRFMTSKESVVEMVARFRGKDLSCDYEYNFGLIGSPHRDFAISELESTIGDPEHPITTSFLRTLTFLKYLLQYPEMPPHPGDDESKAKLWQDEMTKRRAAHDAILSGYVDQLASAISLKKREALAISLNTLLENKRKSKESGAAPTAADSQLRSKLSSVFNDLPADTQRAILQYRWSEVDGPSLLPVLRRIYEKPQPDRWDLRDIALKRIYELSPDEARELILKDIQSGRPKLHSGVLGMLPDETLPALDDTLATQLEHLNSDAQFDIVSTYSSLISRYATASISTRVKDVFADKVGRLACAIQAPLIAYFLRVDPAYGIEALEQALASRNRTGCYRTLLKDVAALYWHPDVEKLAIASLNDSNPEVVVDAARMLSIHGSAGAERALWEMLERWHTRAAGNEAKLREELKNKQAIIDLSMIDMEMVRALSSGNGWLTSSEKLAKLKQLCTTDSCRQELTSILKQSDDRMIRVIFSNAEPKIENIYLAQYHPASLPALKEKIAQFPSGTTFTWYAINGDSKFQEQVYSELLSYLKERGMKLEKMDAGQ